MHPPKMLYQELTDKELFSLTKNNDAKAFEALYQRHWSLLIDTAYRRLQSREKAEDLVQDLFISLYQKRHVIEISVSLQAYMCQALKYKVLNEFRTENTRKAYKDALFLNNSCKNDLANHLETKELHNKIDLILASLPKKCRNVFILSRKGNLTNKDISKNLNISISTVEKHIGKALKTIRNYFPEYRFWNN